MIFSAYLRLWQLDMATKIKHNIKPAPKVPRYDCLAMAGRHKAFEELKNKKGQMVFNLVQAREVVNTTKQRRAERILQGKNSLNLSSVFLMDGESKVLKLGDAKGLELAQEWERGEIIKKVMEEMNGNGYLAGWGNPPKLQTYGEKKTPNPFFGCQDGFLFVISNDWQMIEILVIPNGVYTIMESAKLLQDGIFNRELAVLRETAKPLYCY